MKTSRRSFIKGLFGALATLRLGRKEAKPVSGSTTAHQGVGAYNWTTPSQPCGDWELVAEDGRPGPHCTSPLGGNSSSRRSAPCILDSGIECTCCEHECSHCPKKGDYPCESCLVYPGRDYEDDILELQAQMAVAVRQETEETLGLDAVWSCSPPFMIICYPDGTIERMEG